MVKLFMPVKLVMSVKLSGNGNNTRSSVVPYAAVAYFEPEYEFPLIQNENSETIGKLIYDHLKSVNLFHAIQIKRNLQTHACPCRS